jgi:NCS2 family nucleobase:cation symporter-2
VQQTVEAAIEFGNIPEPIKVEISYDEFVIDVLISYIGLPLQFPEEAPAKDDILEDDGAMRLSGFLIRRYADKITSSGRNGLNEIKLHFDH